MVGIYVSYVGIRMVVVIQVAGSYGYCIRIRIMSSHVSCIVVWTGDVYASEGV